MKKTLFSIVIPVFQNRDSLESTAECLLELAGHLPDFDLELVFVDDGSTDGSTDLVRRLVAEHPERIRAVLLTRNFGQTPAIQAGLHHARGDAVGIISCDMQEPHLKFVDMLGLWRQGNKFIIGERVDRREGRRHRWLSGIYWNLVRRFAFPGFPELGYDFCVIDRQIVQQINSMNEKNSSIFVLLYWLGYSPVCVPIVRELRNKGTSQWSFRRKVTFTIDTLIGFTALPSRIITFMGLSMALIAFLYLAIIFFRWLSLHSAPPGWMTVVGLVTLLGSLNLFAVGILSEYLLRILGESRKRPPYVVGQVIELPASPGPI